MASAVTEVHSRVKYEFDDQNLNIRIISDVHPWRFILPDPNPEFTIADAEDGIESLLEIQCNKEDGLYLFDYRILRKADSFQFGPTLKSKSAHHDIDFLWGNSTINILTEESLNTPENAPTEVTISLHIPSDIDQAKYFSQLKELNKTILVRAERAEYTPSGTPLFGKKEEDDKDFVFEEEGNFPE